MGPPGNCPACPCVKTALHLSPFHMYIDNMDIIPCILHVVSIFDVFFTGMSITPEIFVLGTSDFTYVLLYIMHDIYIIRILIQGFSHCVKYSTLGSNVCFSLQCLRKLVGLFFKNGSNGYI